MEIEGCNVCVKRGICKWYADVTVSTIIGPSFDFRVRVADFMTKILQEYCNNYEKEKVYDVRLPDGTLYGRQKLKLWYPNQEPECGPYCWCQTCYYNEQRKVLSYYREHPYNISREHRIEMNRQDRMLTMKAGVV